jgi:hypothetical protein
MSPQRWQIPGQQLRKLWPLRLAMLATRALNGRPMGRGKTSIWTGVAWHCVPQLLHLNSFSAPSMGFCNYQGTPDGNRSCVPAIDSNRNLMGEESRKLDELGRLKQKLRSLSTDELIKWSASLRQRTRSLSEELKAINEQLEAELDRRKKKP